MKCPILWLQLSLIERGPPLRSPHPSLRRPPCLSTRHGTCAFPQCACAAPTLLVLFFRFHRHQLSRRQDSCASNLRRRLPAPISQLNLVPAILARPAPASPPL